MTALAFGSPTLIAFAQPDEGYKFAWSPMWTPTAHLLRFYEGAALVQDRTARAIDTPPGPMVASDDGVLAVGEDGSVHRLKGRKWAVVAGPTNPPKFPTWPMVVWDATRKRILALDKDAPSAGVWHWDGAWQHTRTTGKVSLKTDKPHMAILANRGALLLIDGKANRMALLEGTAWRQVSLSLEGAREYSPLLVFEDASTSRTILLAEVYGPAEKMGLWALSGDSWDPVATIPLPPSAHRGSGHNMQFSWDPTARSIVGAVRENEREVGVVTLELGAFLDGLVVGPKDPARLEAARPPRRTFPMKPAKRGAAAGDRLGGLPPIASGRWPACDTCKHPMTFVGVFHAHEDRLPLAKHVAIVAFYCQREPYTCRSSRPGSGANAAWLLTKSQLATPPRAAPKDALVNPETALAYGKPITEDPDDDEETLWNKLGGVVAAVTGVEPPICDECKAPMLLAAQFDADIAHANFGDAGVGYVFCCPEEHQAKFGWQAS